MTDTTIPAATQLQSWLDGNTSVLSKFAVRAVLWDLAEAQEQFAASVLAEIYAEQGRQLAKFGEQYREDGTGGPVMQHRAEEARACANWLAENGGVDWRSLLLAQAYSAVAEGDQVAVRAGLVKTAALCTAWIEDIDFRSAGATP